MAKFRSYFADDLDSLKASISDLLVLSSESLVDEVAFAKFVEYFEVVSILLSNRDYSDLIRKK